VSSNIASGYTPEQDDVLKTLGLAVVAGQGVERLMSTCLTFVLRDEPLVSPEQLDGILRRHSRGELGFDVLTGVSAIGLTRISSSPSRS